MIEEQRIQKQESEADNQDSAAFLNISSTGSEASGQKGLGPPNIEGFEIIEYIGAGSMGTVWKARQKSVNREVALKCLPLNKLDSDASRARFEREVQLAGKLNHDNIARVYDSGIHKGVYFYAMELIHGIHIDLYVKQKQLSDPQILSLMEKVCKALEYAHQHGVIHRDLKPSNILVTENGKPYVVDFGIAKSLQDQNIIETPHQPDAGIDRCGAESENFYTQTMTEQGSVPGTLSFMSPEQARGDPDEVNTQSDIYSLGVILYGLLLGHNPHNLAGNIHMVRDRIAHEDIFPPHSFRPTINKKLEDILSMALARDPVHRYAHVSDLAKDLHNYPAGPLLCHPMGTGEKVMDQFRKYYFPIAIGTTLITVLAIITVCTLVDICQINTISLYDLVGFMVVASLAMVFFVIYISQGRKLLDLLYASIALIMSFYSFVLFLSDNTMPLGELAVNFQQSAREMLLYNRLMSIFGMYIMTQQIHFVLIRCNIWNWLCQRVYLLYALFALSAIGVFSDAFLLQRLEPLTDKSSWACIVPWTAKTGPGAVLFTIAWLVVQFLLCALILRHKKDEEISFKGRASQIKLVFWAFTIIAIGGASELFLTICGWAGASLLPLIFMIWGVVMAVALVQERRSEES